MLANADNRRRTGAGPRAAPLLEGFRMPCLRATTDFAYHVLLCASVAGMCLSVCAAGSANDVLTPPAPSAFNEGAFETPFAEVEPLFSTGESPWPEWRPDPMLCPQVECRSPACWRGKDWLGAPFHAHHDGQFVDAATRKPIVAVHQLLDHLQHCKSRLHDSLIGDEPAWVTDGESAGRCGKWSCLLVNWRLNSMHLVGCVPEGYYELPFIVCAPVMETHAGTFHEGDPVEPGGSNWEAARVEGGDERPLAAVSLNIAPPVGDLPVDRSGEKFASAGQRMHLPGTHRAWCGNTFYWNASLLNHQPLYFEDVNLERHGFSYGCWQPLVSGAKFFGTIPALPYLVVAQPPQTTQYTLGETRPGNHAQYVYERPPLNFDAAATEAGVITALFFIIP